MSKKQTVVILDVKTPSMARAIRAKCLNCSGYQRAEVRDCVLTDCPLFPYRFGKGPKAAINSLGKSYTVKVVKGECATWKESE